MNNTDKAEKALGSALSLITLPLISRYRYLQFNGLADGSLLTPNFDMRDLQNSVLVLKGIKIIPEYVGGGAVNQDLYLTDGVTVNQELIPGNTRINRLFDDSAYGTTLRFFINESVVPIFPQFTPIVPPLVAGNVPLDLDIDNIYFKYDAKVNSIGVSVDAQIFNVLNVPAAVTPNVKVFIQCYLI